MKEDPIANKITWRRVQIAGAGITIDQHPNWPTLDGERLVFQRFSNQGTVSVRWGMKATIDEVLAHAGLGSGGSVRTIEADHAEVVDGIPARKIRFRVTAPKARAGGMSPPPPADREQVYVFVGFNIRRTPVLVGYKAPLSELAAVAPLLEHILTSIKRVLRCATEFT